MTVEPTTRAGQVLRAGDVMIRDVGTLSSDASVTEAWRLLFASGRTHLLIVHDGRCVGIVDDRVIALEWPSGAFESRRRQVVALCHGDPATVPSNATIRDVAQVMERSGRTAVAVVTDDGRPLGLITAADLVAALALCPVKDLLP